MMFDEEHLRKIQNSFESLMNTSFYEQYMNLYNKYIYYSLIDKCYDDIFYIYFNNHQAINHCPSPMLCKIPKMTNVKCIYANVYYEHYYDIVEKFYVHLPKVSEFVELFHGCII